MMVEQGYWLKHGSGGWRRVSMQDYIDAEQAAGFRPSRPGHLVATASFANVDGTVRGTTLDPSGRLEVIRVVFDPKRTGDR